MIVYGDDKYYVMTSDYDYQTYSSKTIMHVYDAQGLTLLEDNIDMGSVQPLYWGSGTYDEATGKIYFPAWNADYDRCLFSYDVAQKTTTQVCKFSKTPSFLAIGADGYLYGLTAWDSGALYKYDKESGKETKVGSGVSAYSNGSIASCGAIDFATGTLYAVLQHSDYSMHLYAISTTTGEAELLGDMPENERFEALHIKNGKALAPAPAQNVSFTPDGDGALSGTLQFTAPTTTQDGTAELSGTLTLHLIIDGQDQTRSIAPGAQFSEQLSFSNGQHHVKLYLTNDAGDSQERRFAYFAGIDLPGAATNVQLSIDETTRQASLSWTAPTTSQAGGQIDLSEVTYNIVRMPHNELVAENIKDATFTETLTDERAHYYYKVISMLGTQGGDTAVSNVVISGTYYVPPFKDTFDDESEIDGWTIQDGDGTPWHYDAIYGSYAMMCSHATNVNDDYFITPAVRLQQGRAYKVYCLAGGSTEAYIDVYISKNKHFDGTETRIGHYQLDEVTGWAVHSTAKPFADAFEVDADGDYYIAFCFAGKGEIYLDDIEVRPDATADMPAAVEQLTLTAGEKGALTETFSFTAPTKTYGGSTLESIDKVCIFEDVYENTPIYTFDNVTPGQTLTWTCAPVEQGNHKYVVRAYNEVGAGREATAANYVGLDTPLEPADLVMFMAADGVARMQWSPSTNEGVNGGYVNPDDVTYTIVRYNAEAYAYDTLAVNLKGTEFTDYTFAVPTGQQQAEAIYCIIAQNATGKSEMITRRIVLGTPYEMPYADSFSEQAYATTQWTGELTQGDAGTLDAGFFFGGRTNSPLPQDEDGGYVRFLNPTTDTLVGHLVSPRVRMQHGAALSFYMFHGDKAKAEDTYINIYAQPGDEDARLVATVPYNNGQSGWQRHSVSLNEYGACDNARVWLEGVAKSGVSLISLDNIRIDKQYPYDLSITRCDAPQRIQADSTGVISLTITNIGTETSAACTLTGSQDGTTFATADVSALAPNESQTVTLNYTARINDALANVALTLQTAWDDDQNQENNTEEVSIFVGCSNNPTVSITAADPQNDDVQLTWTTPVAEKTEPVVESFEDYEAFIYDNIGDWKVYDGDKYETTYYNAESVPGAFEKKAWWVWNSEEAGFKTTESVKAHTGKQQLAAFSAIGEDESGDYVTYPNLNWLISPLVDGGTDVSFWCSMATAAYGPETFQVLYSTGSDDPADFQLLAEGSIQWPVWTEFTYTLPREATRFAILHNTKKNSQVLFLDDITYSAVGNAIRDLTLKGYNIWRDGELIATEVSGNSFCDAGQSRQDHSYQVSVVWEEGESMLSEVWLYDATTGLQKTTANGVRVSTSDGQIIIDNPEGLPLSIYSVGGQLVHQSQTAGTIRVNVQRGAYVVKSGEKNIKLRVN